MKTLDKLLIAAVLTAVCITPVMDKLAVSTIGDQVAYEVCWSRHGPIFPARWLCESAVRSNVLLYAVSCSWNKDIAVIDVCTTFERVRKENSPEGDR